MPQELIITLVNDCTCAATGECTCEDDICNCECECIECEIDYLTEGCACGGNCGCSSV